MKKLQIFILTISLFAFFSGISLAQTNKGDGPPPLPKKAENVEAANDQAKPPTPPPIPKKQFWIVIGEEQKGPYNLTALKKMVADGRVTADTLVWKKGMKDWTEAEKVPELAELFKNRPPKVSAEKLLKRKLVGTWHGERNLELGGMSYELDSELSFMSDGTLSGVETYKLAGGGYEMYGYSSPPYVVTYQGRWKVKPINSKKFTLIVNITSVTSTGTGSYPQQKTNVGKWMFIDDNHIKNLDEDYVLEREQ